MNPELLSSMAGAILSLLVSYVPGLNTAYDKLNPTAKRLVMAALVAVAAIVSAAWSCSSPESKETIRACLAGASWRTYVQSVIAALVANQAMHRISPGDVVKPTPNVRRKRFKAAVKKEDAN